MSSVRWNMNWRKSPVFVGLLTVANLKCFLDYQQAQMSGVCWIIARPKCLVFVGLLTGANAKCFLDY